MNLIKHQNQFTFRNISNLMHYCCSLNYVNNLLFDHFEAEILKKLKRIEEAIDKQEEQEALKMIAEEEAKLQIKTPKKEEETEDESLSDDEKINKPENPQNPQNQQTENKESTNADPFEGIIIFFRIDFIFLQG